MRDITFVCTSCGRFDLLKKTIYSFFRFHEDDIAKLVIIDNGYQYSNMQYETYRKLVKNCVPYDYVESTEFIINRFDIGQVSSIDTAYGLVKTKYIFHCEDDWFFHKNGFLDNSRTLLEYDPHIMNVNIRDRFCGQKGSDHPIVATFEFGKIKYHRYMQNYCGVYHGFSWNPGLRRLSDYLKIAPFSKYKNEEGMNDVYQKLGYYSVCLDETYCHHMGEGQETLNRNE